MEHLPNYISIVFILTTLLTIYLFYQASNRSARTMLIVSSWLALQAFVSATGFYTVTDTLPPRFALLIVPPVLVIISLFISKKGKVYLDELNLANLTILHVIRIPVELGLYWLFLQKVIPELMTFEGRNFDILAGLTAPVIYYLGFIKKSISRKVILIWNFICLALLMNIVINAALSAPFPFQQFAFDQPNIALLYFPFVWLPCCVVPIVLLSHLAAIRQLLRKGQ